MRITCDQITALRLLGENPKWWINDKVNALPESFRLVCCDQLEESVIGRNFAGLNIDDLEKRTRRIRQAWAIVREYVESAKLEETIVE